MSVRLTRLVLLAAPLLALTAVAVAAPCSHGGPPAATPPPAAGPDFSRPPTNAALVYLRVWMLEADHAMQRAAEVNWADPAFTLTPEIRSILVDNDGTVGGLLRAASIRDCDWGIQYDQGFLALLPHLSKLRTSARLLAVDARAKVALGDPAAAAERAAAVFTLAEHCAHDNLIITSLVAQAIANLGFDLTAAIEPSLTPDGRARILEAAGRLDTDDPFGAKAAVRTEGDMIHTWIKPRCTGPDAGKKFIALTAVATGTSEQREREVHLKLTSADQAALHADLDGASRVIGDTLAAWDAPDVQARLTAIASDIEAGKYGTAALIISPSLGKANDSTRRSITRLRDLLGRLRQALPPADK